MLKKHLLLVAAMTVFQVTAMDVPHTDQAIVIDGKIDEAWHKVQWQAMPYLMSGTRPDKSDFDGHYRLLWDKEFLYVQAKITDDILFDRSADPLVKYWDDDCLEIFIDSDASGGDHQFNHSAFAYHISLDNQVADIGEDKKPHLYNEHLKSSWRRSNESPNTMMWEVAIRLYPNNYSDKEASAPLELNKRDVIGFMLAYCDNDTSEHREHFMGSHDITPVNGDKNRGWIDASVFGKIVLAN
jgi:hypothetical protein